MNLSSMFKRPEKYTDIKPQTPAEKVTAEWDKRDGYWIVQNNKLWKFVIGQMVIIVVLAGGLVMQSLKSSVLPYIVEVDTQTGHVRNAGILKESSYVPKEEETKYFIRTFLTNIREVPLDPVVYQANFVKAWAFMTQDCAVKMNSEVTNSKMRERFGKKTVQVEIISVLPIEGSSSYQVQWNEQEFMVGSGQKEKIPMTGIFTITTIPPKDEKTIEQNPLGIYISDFNWQRNANSSQDSSIPTNRRTQAPSTAVQGK